MRRLLAVACTLLAALLGATGSVSADPAAAAETAVPPLVLVADDAGHLAVPEHALGADPAAVHAVAGLAFTMRWDLEALERAAYRSDLVRLELLDAPGPGRFAILSPTSLGPLRTVVDSAVGPTVHVLQVGRSGTLAWRFDTAGDYELTFAASIPTAGGTTVRTPLTVRLRVGDPEAPTTADGAEVGSFQAAQARDRVVIAQGHVDMGPRLLDGQWRIQLKDDSGPTIVWRELADIVLHARASSLLSVPDREAYRFLGAPGTPVYVLPQSQRPDLVWPGWNTQDPQLIQHVSGTTTWRLLGVDGPGRFVLYLADSFGDTEVLFDTASALPQSMEIRPNTHAHGNWAFTEAGVYRLRVQMDATADDGRALSDTRTLTIVVGDDVDPTTAFTDDPTLTTPAAPAGSTATTAPGGSGAGATGSNAAGPTSRGSMAFTGPIGLVALLGVAGISLALGTAAALAGRRRRSATT